jgi:hypothetical protein
MTISDILVINAFEVWEKQEYYCAAPKAYRKDINYKPIRIIAPKNAKTTTFIPASSYLPTYLKSKKRLLNKMTLKTSLL